MNATTRVDFHCHSTYSDGVLGPREIAQQLAADKVAFAALTDHDSVDGLASFEQTLSRRDVGSIAGVELSAQCNGDEAHLLGYGFDPANAELQATLVSLRQAQTPEARTVAGTRLTRPIQAQSGAAPRGTVGIGEAIALIHRAGGRAFLAHPLVLQSDLDKLRVLLTNLKEQGLDGIEAIYGPYTRDEREGLCKLAADLGLLVSAGSDAHDRRSATGQKLGVDMPTELWKQFRDAVCCGPDVAHSGMLPAPPPPRLRMKRRHFFFHIVFPTLLAIALFAAALFGVFLPALERSLLERKRETIRELTESAWSILAGYERDERTGVLSREQAQSMAAERIGLLRYGREGKDYFWLQDMHPRMIMHPYRKDLDGKDVSEFQDARRVPIFVEFADLVRREREGYIGYVWQWKDDPSHLAPKESYIKGFEPWGWIIGTGIYTEDVKREIARIEQRLVYALLAISLIVALLLLYVMQQGLRLERDRLDAEEGLRETTDRYRSLVEATTEGTLLVLDGRCRYANPVLLEMLGCSAQELALLDLEDVLPDAPENQVARGHITGLLAGAEPSGGFDGVLKRRDGVLIECVLALSRISFSEKGGLILLAKAIGLSPGGSGPPEPLTAGREGSFGHISDAIPAGVFRARATPQGTVLECSRSTVRLLGVRQGAAAGEPLTLSTVFPDSAAYEDFLSEVQRDGAAERRLHLSTDDPGTRTVSIRAILARDERGEGRFLDGIIEDITLRDKRAAEREALLQRLQASMLFLHEPVGHIARSPVFCPLNASVRAVAAAMSANQSSEALMQSESGETVGIFTDRDLRERIVAAGGDLDAPIHRVMSAPLVTVPEHAELYEALLAMEEQGVHHLAITDHAGGVVGVIRNQELLQFPSYGPIVLAREITRADTPEHVVASCRRAPALAKVLLDSGAHPQRVTRMITSVLDAAAEAFIGFAQEQLGPPPARFAFLALGSHGREELVLSSDQDNAIVYSGKADDAPEVAAYFRELGRLTCERLDQAGYAFCDGDVMARNPKWCRPLTVWKDYFSDWIHRAEPQELLQFSIFFDFRAVCGDAELAGELRAHVYEVLSSHPSFFLHLAQNVLTFKPPMRLFGRILSGATGGEQPGLLDVKDALMPIVCFARLYALREGLDQTHTLDRLAALAEANVLTDLSRDETVAAYDFLMRLRLENQAADLDTDQALDNLVNYRRLGHLEETLLNQSFAQIAALQKRIGHDFFGGG